MSPNSAPALEKLDTSIKFLSFLLISFFLKGVPWSTFLSVTHKFVILIRPLKASSCTDCILLSEKSLTKKKAKQQGYKITEVQCC